MHTISRYTLISLLCFCFTLHVAAQNLDAKVDRILQLMTLQEKVGQMTQVERSELIDIQHLISYGIGSILSGGGSSPTPNTVASWATMYDEFQEVALQSFLGIPIIYAIDAVHGHNNVRGAVIFPHNIGMGCTWNPDLIVVANQIVAREVAATGIDWTFAPCIAIPRNERWGRTYEGFGETAEIQSIMAEASVIGLQGDDLSQGETILGCAKHFVGDGGTIDGIDQGNTILSEEALRSIHMAGYIDAIEANVGTVMASYSSWNGEKLHGHDYLLTQVLKNELGFEGFVISDWKGVDQVDENYRTAIKRAINAGVDMVMVPDRYEVYIAHLIKKYQVEVTQSGTYNMMSRISGYDPGIFLVTFNENNQIQISFDATDGWQNWKDFNTAVYLEEGTYNMQVNFQSGAFNINYFDFELATSAVDNTLSAIDIIKVYPNPIEDEFTVEFTNDIDQKAKIKLIDPTGKDIQILYQGNLQNGLNKYAFTLLPNLTSGVYFLEIKDANKRYFKKIMKK